MQFKIPTDVQIEDKILGPLTLKQLITVGVGGGLAYAVYVILARTYYWEVWAPPIVIIIGLTALITFVRPKGLTFIDFVLALIETYFNDPIRAWKQGSGDTYPSVTAAPPKRKKTKKETKKEEKDKETLGRLEEISKIVDTGGKHNI